MKVKKKIILFFATAFAALALGAGIATNVSVADEGTLSEVSYQKQYSMNEVLTIQDATITCGNKAYEASAVLHYPSGKTCALDTAALTEQGEYVLAYNAITDDGLVSKEISFTVLGERYTFEGSGSVSYGETAYLDGYTGLNVSLNRNSTFVYNQVIDVSDNVDAVDVIRFYVTPQLVGEREISTIYVRMTDVYDPDNYVETRYVHVTNVDQYTYISSKANNGQPWAGLHAARAVTAETVEYEGRLYNPMYNHRYYGFNAGSSFTGVMPISYNKDSNKIGWTFENNYQRLAIDYETKKIHAQLSNSSPQYTQVIDLDDPILYGDTLWDGFTTGEVILSVYAEGYQGASFNFFITTIDGEAVSADGVVNTIAPQISVDFGEGLTEEELPQAIVGKEYGVFSATARDEYEGTVNCDALVWYNYNNSARTLVSVKDGKFTPKRKGVYTIEYTACDSFGNEGKRCVEIEAIERESLIYEFGDSEKTFDVATKVGVSTLTVENGTVGAGLDIRAKLKGSDVVYPIDNEKLTFFPLYSGTYVIEYEYSDYIETQVMSYEITVNKLTAPQFVDDVVLPRYFLKDCNYYISDYYGYDFSNGTERIKAEIYTKVANGEQTALANNAFTATTTDTVEVIYKLTASGGTAERSFTVPVVDANYGKPGQLDLSKYLQGNAFSAVASDTGVAYTTNANKATAGEATLSLVNTGYWNVFSTEFSVDATDKDYNGVTVVLTDEKEHDNKLTLSYTRAGNATAFKLVCGDIVVEKTIDATFETTTFKAAVDNGNFVVSGTDISMPVTELLDGFSNRFYVDITLSGVYGTATLHVKRLMNQQISNLNADMVKPVLIFTPFQNEYDLGDTIVISAFDAYDFVDPSPKVAYYLVNAQGQYVTSEEGTALNGTQSAKQSYTISCNDYFSGTLGGEARDYSNRKESFSFSLNVTDKIAPIIVLDGGNTSGEVGSTIKLASYTVSDDRDSDLEVYIQIIDPTGRGKVYKNAEEFTPDKAGKYRIVYCVMDATSNMTFAEYTVTVK